MLARRSPGWIAVVLTALLLGSCAESKDGSSQAQPGPSPSAAVSDGDGSDGGAEGTPVGTNFVSYRYGYSITLPTGWDGRKALVDLKPGQIPNHTADSVDRYEPGPDCKEGQCGVDRTAKVTLFAGAAPTDADLDGYSSAFAKGMAKRSVPCGEPTSTEGSTLDGEPAVLMSWSCSDDSFVMTVLTVRADESFVVGWWGAEGTEKQQRETFETALSTFTFD